MKHSEVLKKASDYVVVGCCYSIQRACSGIDQRNFLVSKLHTYFEPTLEEKLAHNVHPDSGYWMGWPTMENEQDRQLALLFLAELLKDEGL